MIATKPSDDIQDFLSFMARAMGPDAVRKRIGATDGEVARLVELVPLPLPPLYIGYLREFGQYDGALGMSNDSDYKISILIDFYTAQKKVAWRDMPVNGLAIGVNGIGGGIVLLYPKHVSKEKGLIEVEEEPTVVVAEDELVLYPYAQTFRNHIYRHAFMGCLGEGERFALVRRDEKLLSQAKPVVIQQGFVPHWFEDDYQACFERDDGSALYIERTPDRDQILGCFRDERTRAELKSILIKELGVREGAPDWTAHRNV